MLSLLRRLVPVAWLRLYHYLLARAAAWFYGHPSRELIVIGVTGTKGKTTTSYLIAKALEAKGDKVGLTSTAVFKVGDREWVNNLKMTMPGRFFLQRMLREMVKAGCRYAIVETSSQGLIQSRHRGIAYDLAVFTNLTPEHLEAHGGFENYKRVKRVLFETLAALPFKYLNGELVPRVAIFNADDPAAHYYADTPELKAVRWYGIEQEAELRATNIQMTEAGSLFRVSEVDVQLPLPGHYNISNALAALTVADVLNIPLGAAAACLARIKQVPGRFERIEAGQPWTAIVDYAYEPESLKKLYEVIKRLPHQRIIHVFGSCGGGRDEARQPVMGHFVGREADIAIVTNEDPYDDAPRQIIDRIAAAVREEGKKDGESLFCVDDRREAIQLAMNVAQPGDMVLMTGKGNEPWICVANGKKLPWNEAEIAREAIQRAHQVQ